MMAGRHMTIHYSTPADPGVEITRTNAQGHIIIGDLVRVWTDEAPEPVSIKKDDGPFARYSGRFLVGITVPAVVYDEAHQALKAVENMLEGWLTTEDVLAGKWDMP